MLKAEVTHNVQNFIIFPKRQIYLLPQSGIAVVGFAVINPVVLHVTPIDPVNYILGIAAVRGILIYIGFQNISYLFRNRTSSLFLLLPIQKQIECEYGTLTK